MDSIDAQQLLLELVGAEMPPPDYWEHHRDGRLTCAYSGGERSFSWDPAAVADMARRWRSSRSAGSVMGSLPEIHRRLNELIRNADRPPAEIVIHDLASRELRAVWPDDEFVLIVETEEG